MPSRVCAGAAAKGIVSNGAKQSGSLGGSFFQECAPGGDTGSVELTDATVGARTAINRIHDKKCRDSILDFQALDMNEVARQAVDKYSAKAAGREIQIAFDPHPGLPPVYGDARSLERALMALLDNAIKFSQPGSSVEVRLRSDNGRVCVAIEDHGIGIPGENLPRISDRFYHLDRSGADLFRRHWPGACHYPPGHPTTPWLAGCRQRAWKRKYIYCYVKKVGVERYFEYEVEV